MKKTLIIGASANPDRYSYKAAEQLIFHGHDIEMIGKRSEIVFGQTIDTVMKEYDDIDTVTMYISEKFQPEYYQYIIALNPNRVIFNPGTENPEFEKKLVENDIHVEEACTLVLLRTAQY